MEYNAESIEQLAEMVVTTLREALARSRREGVALPEIEQGLRELLRAVGAAAVGQFLSTGQGTPVTARRCRCGELTFYQRQRTATVISVFGRVAYTRAYYAGCACGRGTAPVDDTYGLRPGEITVALGNLLGLAGVELAFEQSCTWLEAFLLFRVSENSVREQTEALGALQAQTEAELCARSQNEDALQARLRAPGTPPRRLYGSLDAAKVRIEPRQPAEKQAEHESWRDLKIGCWYEAEAVPPAQRSTRQREKVDRAQPILRAKHIRYFCDIAEANEFGQLLWGTGCAANADRTPELIFVCDGAPWIWNLIEHYYPHARQIIDWYHAEEYLERVAQAAFSDPAQRPTWLEPVTDQLWQGQVETVIQACERLAGTCAEARRAVTYFTHHAARMRYDQFRAAGYLIGSGTVESGCKQIVAQRLKRSGAQWLPAGAVCTAKARAAWLSGEWSTLCARRAALPLAA
jgi:hypothetical protein